MFRVVIKDYDGKVLREFYPEGADVFFMTFEIKSRIEIDGIDYIVIDTAKKIDGYSLCLIVYVDEVENISDLTTLLG